jgi:glutamate synthase domain-containing protein 2
MFRRAFYAASAVLLVAIAILSFKWPAVLWSLVVVLPLVVVGFRDARQTSHSILRNFPLLGRARYVLEEIRPEIQQYFIESTLDAFPIEREHRSLVYQRAKGDLESHPFGTHRDVYGTGYEWAAHALAATTEVDTEERLLIGGPDCPRPYAASRLNISAMSFGSLSPTAVLALNGGARSGGFAHNTGEGGISPWHIHEGGDLIWQIGTAYFGCRTRSGSFDQGLFAENAARDQVRMIEIKLSQGAKPGHGGVLPGPKVTEEIARIRNVPVGETVLSPARHSAFDGPVEMMQFVARLREASGGKPVGIKLCVGRRTEFFSLCKAMIETGISPDFITVDGGEGGTGAAPLEFSNSIGMPASDAWAFAHGALTAAGLRDRLRILASGKILTGFHMVRALALGADACNSARGMMLAMGCIQALRCNSDTCPTGVATQNPALYHGLVPGDKRLRVARFHQATMHSFREILGAMGVSDPADVSADMIFRRVSDVTVRTYAELYPFPAPGALVEGGDVPDIWTSEWNRATADTFAPTGGAGARTGRGPRQHAAPRPASGGQTAQAATRQGAGGSQTHQAPGGGQTARPGSPRGFTL